MEDLNNEISKILDNSDKIQPNNKNTLENEISLNLEQNIQKELEEFEAILNIRQPDSLFNENDLNLDDINDIINEHLFNNEELTHDDSKISENIVLNAEIVSNITISSTNDDIISISSTDSLASGYRSSDFEFITEAEANRDSLIINFRSNNDLDPGEGASAFVIPPSKIINEYIDRSSNTFKYRKRFINYGDRTYRNNHQIPDGDGYLNLFQGIYDPLLQQFLFMENKSIKTTVMNVEFDGIGFDKQLVGKPSVVDSSDEEFEDEAKVNANRIITMYPRDNSKRRRRY